MKYFLLTLLAGSLFLAGCSKKSGSEKSANKDKFAVDTTDIRTTAVNNPNEAFKLIYKFEKGKKYRYRLSSVTHDEQTLKEDSSITKKLDRSLIYIVDISQSGKDKNGLLDLDCTIKSIKLDENINGKKYSFESGPKLDSTQIAKFTEFYALLNNPFQIKIEPNGGIKDITNVDKIIDKYIKARKGKNKFNSMQKMRLENGLSNGLLKPIVAQLFREMPKNTVSKDSTWEIKQPPARYMIFHVFNSDSYKINSLGIYNNDKLAVINAGLKTQIEGKTNIVQNGVKYNFKKPETTTSGKIYFNVSKGYIQKSKIKSALYISFKMEGMTAKGKKKRSDNEKVLTSNIVELL